MAKRKPPERKNFSRATFAKIKREWDRRRKLPEDSPVWHMTKIQWNAISEALAIAAKRAAR